MQAEPGHVNLGSVRYQIARIQAEINLADKYLNSGDLIASVSHFQSAKTKAYDLGEGKVVGQRNWFILKDMRDFCIKKIGEISGDLDLSEAIE